MTGLGLAALSFFLLHRVGSGSPMRDRVVAQIGERWFIAGFALASLGGPSPARRRLPDDLTRVARASPVQPALGGRQSVRSPTRGAAADRGGLPRPQPDRRRPSGSSRAARRRAGGAAHPTAVLPLGRRAAVGRSHGGGLKPAQPARLRYLAPAGARRHAQHRPEAQAATRGSLDGSCSSDVQPALRCHPGGQAAAGAQGIPAA